MDMHFVGKIDRGIFKCISDDIVTDEVIITDERIEHIEERHPDEYVQIRPFLGEALRNPDYILKDGRWNNTGIVLKMIETEGMRIQIVVRVRTSFDENGYKNSIISAWKIGKRRWDNYIRNKEILYKKP